MKSAITRIRDLAALTVPAISPVNDVLLRRIYAIAVEALEAESAEEKLVLPVLSSPPSDQSRRSAE